MTTSKHVTSDILDLRRVGALSEAASMQLTLHLASCERCRASNARYEEDVSEFDRDVLSATMPNVVDRIDRMDRSDRVDQSDRIDQSDQSDQSDRVDRVDRVDRDDGVDRASVTPLRRWTPAILLAAAVAAIVPLVIDRPADLRIKGGPEIRIFVRRADRVFLLKAGEALRVGDRLRFIAEGAEKQFLTLLGHDQRGEMRTYYDGEQLGRIETLHFELPGSLELDETAGPEVFYAIFSESPIPASVLLSDLKDDGAIEHGVATRVIRSAFPKGSRP